MKKITGKAAAKRTACIITAGMMAMSAGFLTGCSGSSSSRNNTAIVDQQEAMKTLAYKVTEVPVDLEISGNVVAKNGLFYTQTRTEEQKGDAYYSNSYLTVFDQTGSTTLSIPVFIQENDNEYGGIDSNIFVDDSGTITCIVYYGSWDNETGDSTYTRRLIKYDSTGKEISSTDLSNIVTQEDEQNGLYFNSYLVDAQGNIYFNLSQCIRVCDSNGNKLFDTPKTNGDNSSLNGMFMTNSGVPAVIISDYSNNQASTVIKEVDLNAKGYGAEHSLTASYIYNPYNGSGDYLCYYSSDTGIMGLRADTYAPEQVLNLLNLGIDNSNISGFCVNSDGSFITVTNEYKSTGSVSTLSVISPVDSSEVKEKKILSLGCFYLDWNIRSDIAEFNKTNENYTIYATCYSETNDTSDYEAALTKFNNELLAGNVPDILLLNSEMPYDSYAAKGLFADLYELMENDPDYSKDSFMPNILQALEKDGKLYEISPTFYVSTYAAKKSLVGDVTSITMDKANQILATMPEGASLTNYDNTMSASNFLENALAYSSFVDYANGKCSFDTPEFKAILEMAKKYPAEVDYDAIYNDNPNYWTEQETACRENRALLYSIYFNDFSSYTSTRDAYFGEEISLVGFPGNAGEGEVNACLYLGTQLAVSDKSQYKEGAWEFIKGILDSAVYEEEYYGYSEISYQDGGSSWSSNGNDSGVTKTHLVSKYYGLPVVKSQIEALGKQATLPETYIDENGKEVESEVTYYVGDQEVKVNRITQDEVNYLIDYFSKINRVSRTDSQISNIINEESAAFFNGTKSVDETASLIQSRASIYLSEQY